MKIDEMFCRSFPTEVRFREFTTGAAEIMA
jgi:hypothetical protein